MKKHLIFVALVFVALLSACSKEKPACQKVIYKNGTLYIKINAEGNIVTNLGEFVNGYEKGI